MILIVLVAAGVAAYMWWKWTHTTLTRNCRWRQDRAAGDWRCVACGARTRTGDGKSPRICLMNGGQGAPGRPARNRS